MYTKHKRLVRFRFVFLFIAALLATACTLLYMRPLPALPPTTTFILPAPKTATALAWASSAEAAIGAVGYGILDTSGVQTPRPTASVAKIITALAVLNKHPLAIGETGPTLTLDDNDVASYNQYVAENGSVALVQAGEQLSEYQALETMLLPSANNMADSLARWAYGSLPNYSTAANQLVKNWGLTHTTIGTDASGLDPSTVSTASDLLNIGLLTMQNPVLAQIVGESHASEPVAGTVTNTNILLGQDGVIGIKTGNTDQAGGVFISAAQQTIGNQKITIVSAVVGAPDLQTALTSSIPLLNSAKANFVTTKLAQAGTVVGTYLLPWGGTAKAVAQRDVSLITWLGVPIKTTIALNTLNAPLPENSEVGYLSFASSKTSASTQVILKQTLPAPSNLWRIIRHNF